MKLKVEYYRVVYYLFNYWFFVEIGKVLNNKNVFGFFVLMVKGFDLVEYKYC